MSLKFNTIAITTCLMLTACGGNDHSSSEVPQPQPQPQRNGGHGQQGGKAHQLARHEQQAVAFGGRAGRHHRQVDEDARQIEQACKPAGHENDVKGFDPEHGGSLRAYATLTGQPQKKARQIRRAGKACAASLQPRSRSGRKSGRPSFDGPA